MDSRGINDESVEKFQLGVDPESGRLTIPYLTQTGPLVVKYRCMALHDCKDHGHGKYMNDVGANIHLFNAQGLLAAELAVLVEGELDAISVSQIGLTGVAYPGTAMWKAHPHWRWCFDSLDEVVVVCDGDEPGKKAGLQVAESLRTSVSADVRLIVLPDGHDSNSYLIEYGETDYLQRLELL